MGTSERSTTQQQWSNAVRESDAPGFKIRLDATAIVQGLPSQVDVLRISSNMLK